MLHVHAPSMSACVDTPQTNETMLAQQEHAGTQHRALQQHSMVQSLILLAVAHATATMRQPNHQVHQQPNHQQRPHTLQ